MSAKRKDAQPAQTLKLVATPEDQKKAITEAAADPVIRNMITAECFQRHLGDLDLAVGIDVLRKQTAAVHAGDLKHAETTLTAQASTLDAMFTYLARRALQVETLTQMDSYLRHALRAQSQCRATLETLATIKNPAPVAFVKQANIANGPQQVNNGEPVARAEQNASRPTELLEAPHAKPQWMDAATPDTASGADSQLETVAAIDRAANA